MTSNSDIVTTLRRESFYQPTSRINEFGKPQLGFELTRTNLLAADEIERLRKERDEARREVCRGEAMLRLQRNRVHRESEEVVRMAKEIAVERGWDCFKENTNE